jgi:hypothetical protein
LPAPDLRVSYSGTVQRNNRGNRAKALTKKVLSEHCGCLTDRA